MNATTHPGTNVEPAEFGAMYHQRFAVEYDYPVHFTHDLFSRDNPAFVSALARKEPNKRHRFVVFIDADVAASWPALPHDIAAYAEHHGTRLQLLAPAEIIVGGEQVKHDPELVTRLQHRLRTFGLHRGCRRAQRQEFRGERGLQTDICRERSLQREIGGDRGVERTQDGFDLCGRRGAGIPLAYHHPSSLPIKTLRRKWPGERSFTLGAD